MYNTRFYLRRVSRAVACVTRVVNACRKRLSSLPHTTRRTAMSPRKKQKTTLRDFTNVLSSIANLYDEKGDAGRSRSFTNASTNLCAFADVTNKELDAPLKSSEDFKDVKGVEKSTLEMLDEFIETGKCTRLEELEEKQFKLVDKKSETTKTVSYTHLTLPTKA